MKTFEEALEVAMDLDNTLGDDKTSPAFQSHKLLREQMQSNPRLLRWITTLELVVMSELLPAMAKGDAQEAHDILFAAFGSTLHIGVVIGTEMEKQELHVV